MKQIEKTRQSRERILNAAIKEFGKKGYRGASLNNLCKAGISKGLIYHNFKDRDALYLACVRRCFDRMADYLKSKDTGADTQKYIAARAAYFEEYKEEAGVFFDAILQPPSKLASQIRKLKEGLDAVNLEIYLKILSKVTLRQGVTEDEAVSYFEFMQNVFNSYFDNAKFSEITFSERMTVHEEYLYKIFDYMMYGIAEKKDEK